jgi:hypothetical protein
VLPKKQDPPEETCSNQPPSARMAGLRMCVRAYRASGVGNRAGWLNVDGVRAQRAVSLRAGAAIDAVDIVDLYAAATTV